LFLLGYCASIASCVRSNTVEGGSGGAVTTGERFQLALKKAMDVEPDEQARKLYQGLSEGEVK